MPIAFTCPGCAKRYEVSDALAGKTGRCKQCGGQFTVPVPRHLRAGAGSATSPPSSRPVSSGAAAAPPPRPVPVPPPTPELFSAPVGGLGAFEDDDLHGEVPLAPAGGPRTSRYRAEDGDDEPDDDDLPPTSRVTPKKPKSKKKKSGGSLGALPLPMLIMVVGNLGLVIFLAFVVWPSMQGDGKGGGGAANAAGAGAGNAAFVPPPVPGVPPPAPPPEIANLIQAPAVNGFPGLPAPLPNTYPAGTPRPPGPAIRDLSQHEQTRREALNLVGQMIDTLGSVSDQASAQAAEPRLQTLTQQIESLQQRDRTLPALNPVEEGELSRRLQPEIQGVLDRISAQETRLGRMFGPGVMQFRMRLSRLGAELRNELARAQAISMMPYAEVYVANVPDGDTSGYLQQKLAEAAQVEPSQVQGSWTSPPGSSSFRLWPVENPQALAGVIPFGQASVQGYRITVAAPTINSAELAAFKAKRAEDRARQQAEAKERNRPDPEAPPDADSITKAVVKVKSSNGFKQREGLEALVRTPPEDDRRDEVVSAIQTLLEKPNFVSGEQAVKALANWRNDQVDAILVGLIDSDENYLRNEAMKQCGRLQIAAAAAPIAARISEDWTVAPDALRALGAPAEEALIPLLRNPEEKLRRAACEVLADIGGQETLDTMKKLPADPDLSVQHAARRAMQSIAARIKGGGDK